LKTGEEIEELENSGFFVSGPTIGVGTVLNDSIILQVYRRGVISLTETGTRIKDFPVGSKDNVVVYCSIQDPYVALLMSNGEVIMMSVSESTRSPAIIKVLQLGSMISSVSLFLDNLPTQQFPTVKDILETAQLAPSTKRDSTDAKVVEIEQDDVESADQRENRKASRDFAYNEEDLDLYGETQQEEVAFKLEDLEHVDQTGMDVDESLARSAKVQHWCILVDELGVLRILSLPDLKLCFEFKNFHLGHKFVQDQAIFHEDDSEIYEKSIQEILVLSLGADLQRTSPYLIARNEKSDIMIYKIIPCIEISDRSSKDRLAIQMVRVEHSKITREPQLYNFDGEKVNSSISESKKQKIHPFEKIGALSQQLYAGAFISGKRPFWIMMAHTGGRDCVNIVAEDGCESKILDPAPLNSSNTVRIHPMIVDGPVDSFAPLHNVNIPFGFAYVTDKGLFRLAQLPPQFTYDHEMPICKVMLGRSAHSIAYHMPTQTYALASSTRAVFRIDQARYMAAVAAGVIENGAELPETEKKVSGIEDVIEQRGLSD
jgi:cleavage and polyadenylation specificity factor subunit 1